MALSGQFRSELKSGDKNVLRLQPNSCLDDSRSTCIMFDTVTVTEKDPHNFP